MPPLRLWKKWLSATFSSSRRESLDVFCPYSDLTLVKHTVPAFTGTFYTCQPQDAAHRIFPLLSPYMPYIFSSVSACSRAFLFFPSCVLPRHYLIQHAAIQLVHRLELSTVKYRPVVEYAGQRFCLLKRRHLNEGGGYRLFFAMLLQRFYPLEDIGTLHIVIYHQLTRAHKP